MNKDTVNFRYTNDLGLKKTLIVYTNKDSNGKYRFTILDNAHGELCSIGDATKDEINDFLSHYSIKERFV